jgi:cobalamin biosynthesis protein CobW
MRHHGVVRLKGRLRLPGKDRVLELQAVGPRLESWFSSPLPQGQPAAPGLELVLLGFQLPAQGLEAALEELLPATPGR